MRTHRGSSRPLGDAPCAQIRASPAHNSRRKVVGNGVDPAPVHGLNLILPLRQLTALSFELIVIILLVAANGVLSMTETAVVSSKRARMEERAAKGDRRAARALVLLEHPRRFLSLVQFWLTLSGMIAGVLGGVRLAGRMNEWLLYIWSDLPALARHSHAVALIVVTVALTSFMLVFGELVPKRIGLAYPERVASLLAGVMRALAWLAAPFLRILELAAEGILSLLRFRPPQDSAGVSNAEVRALIEQGLNAGSFNQAEQEMVTGVLELDELPVTELMTPRPKIVFLNLDDSDEYNWRKIVTSGHSQFPVYQSTRDHVIGIVTVKAIWANSAFGLPSSLRNVVEPALTIPNTLKAIHLLERFKSTGKHVAIVLDEFGVVEGLITLLDVLTAIVGELPEPGHRSQPQVRKREDGSWLIDGTLPHSEFKSLLAISSLHGEAGAGFQTVAGFVMKQFGRVPTAGDYFQFESWRIEVVDMDRHRIDKILVSRVAPRKTGADTAAE